MIERKNCYIIDTLANIGKYAALSANMKTACDFIAKGDFTHLVSGRNVIDGEKVFVNRDEALYVLPAERRTEVHHKYFDIHVPLENDEIIGLAEYDESAPGSFDEKKDCGFNDQKVEYFTVKKGQFVLCWPVVCAHAPAITTDAPKTSVKLVVKVKA